MARTKTNSSKDTTAALGFEASVPVREDLAADTFRLTELATLN